MERQRIPIAAVKESRVNFHELPPLSVVPTIDETIIHQTGGTK